MPRWLGKNICKSPSLLCADVEEERLVSRTNTSFLCEIGQYDLLTVMNLSLVKTRIIIVVDVNW